MATARNCIPRRSPLVLSSRPFPLRPIAHHRRPQWAQLPRNYASQAPSEKPTTSSSSPESDSQSQSSASSEAATSSGEESSLPPGWEDVRDSNISTFSELPHKHFGFNQHMIINAEFKEALRQVLWQFRAPIRYAFAYGSGVFPQSSPKKDRSGGPKIHPKPPEAVTKWQTSGEKNIDFIFGVSFTQHWHSLNLQEHRDHYSMLGSFGSGLVSRVQDKWGAGAYFHPYIHINGMMIKYGVVNLDTIYRDLSEWNTMYLAGRLHKPVKILRDDPRMRLANQVNLISAVRTALLMLPPNFTEHELYSKIASISYMGDPRMAFRAESPRKVQNIVDNQMTNFRQLYLPLIDDLPNVTFNDAGTAHQDWIRDPALNCKLQQDMDPVRRGNMVRRLPNHFRRRLYDTYQRIYRIPSQEYRDILEEAKDENTFSKTQGSEFDRRIAGEEDLDAKITEVVKGIINGPSLQQTVKGVVTAGIRKSLRYVAEKRAKGRERRAEASDPGVAQPEQSDDAAPPAQTTEPKSSSTSGSQSPQPKSQAKEQSQT